MRNDTPIACTLEPAQMRNRAAFIDELRDEALLDQHPIDGGLRTTFRDAPDVERRIHELIAAESQCCGFLSFAVGRQRDTFWLDIIGAPEARPVIDQFFAAAPISAGSSRAAAAPGPAPARAAGQPEAAPGAA